MIYLDNASTTKCNEKSAQIIKDALVEDFYNPSAKYGQSLAIFKKLNQCRADILKLVGAGDVYNVVFTGSATEANNLVLNSSLNKHKRNLISAGEHASIHETAKKFVADGYDIREVRLCATGEMDLNEFKNLMTPETAFVSVMVVSNETGAINNIKQMVAVAKSINPKVLIHVDAVQAFCKIKLNVQDLGVDYLTLSSHKVEGPKGVGALVYKKQAKLTPEIYGGGQEDGKRSGTENFPSILGFVNSAKELSQNLTENFVKVKTFKTGLINNLQTLAKERGLEFVINGEPETSSPYILSCGFVGTKGEVLIHALEAEGVLVGTGSACNSKHSGNRVLSSMGKAKAQIECNIRLSFSAETALIDPAAIAKTIVSCAKRHNNTIKK